jgi:ankyrin repeat protein
MNTRIDREMFQAARENNLSEVRRLFSVGVDVNAKGDGDWTLLHWACFEGHVQVVVELLKHGANIEAKDSNGRRPLHWAVMEGQLAVVKALLSGGANNLAADKYGGLPIDEAVNHRKSAVAKYLLQQLYATTRRRPLHELVEDVTWIGIPYSNDAPPLRYALRYGGLGTDDVVEIVEYLVGRKPKLISSPDQDGSLPLHLACRQGAPFAIVQSLANLYKVAVKSVNPQGDLPLFLACELPKTSLDTIFFLMKLYPDLVYR